jgi:hypothetical protein
LITFKVDGTEYQFDETRLLSVEAVAVKKYTGLAILDFFQGCMSGDGEALTALVFLAKKRAGEDVTWQGLLDTLDVMALLMSLIAEADEPDEEPVPEPEDEELPVAAVA